jgi:N-acetylglucosaminyl-diphospho-decaprenol L-rhamnosyltransferase
MSTAATATADLQPLITISVVSHGDWQPLTALLESLTAYEPIGRMQLIVTDNLGNDLPDLAPSDWHSIVMQRPARPRGFAANHNDAFKSATGQFFCILNPDVLFTEDLFDGLLSHIEGERAHMAAPVLVDSRGRVQDSFRELPTPWRIVQRRLGPGTEGVSLVPGKLLYPDWVAGMFMLMRSGTFSQLGGFDGRYRLYFEDVDLCTRLRIAGMKILVDPAFRLQHDPRRRSRRPGRHLLWHLQSAARFFSSDGYRRARRLTYHA